MINNQGMQAAIIIFTTLSLLLLLLLLLIQLRKEINLPGHDRKKKNRENEVHNCSQDLCFPESVRKHKQVRVEGMPALDLDQWSSTYGS